MLFSRNSHLPPIFLLCCILLLITSDPAQAQGKRKKYKKKKKSDVGLVARGYHDITTRNNYYFNAKLIYTGIQADIELDHETDYEEILPLYFHQKTEDLSRYNDDLETIIQKSSVAMALHDNTRWKDDVYLMLGKARYLQGDYINALKTFQFIATTMQDDVGKSKGKVNNKAKLQAAKAKAAEKRAKEKQKEIARKKKELKQKLAKLKRDKSRQSSSSSKGSKKQLEKRIKAKKKIVQLRKKGKTIPDKLYETAYGRQEDKDEDTGTSGDKDPEAKDQQDGEKTPKVSYKTDYRSDKQIKKEEEARKMEELGFQTDTVALTDKEVKKYDKLSLWERIRHKRVRPESLVWMAKSFMELGEMGDAQSMLEYAEAIPKLRRSQREEIYVGQAYYYIENRRYVNAMQSLNLASDLARKRNRAYYSYIMAQLSQRLEDHDGAMDAYYAVLDGRSDYRMKFHANMSLIGLLKEHQAASSEAILDRLERMLKGGSNKEFRDQVHFAIAGIHEAEGREDKAIEHLEASINTSRSNPVQKARSYMALGGIYFGQHAYSAAALFHDSAVAVLPPDHEDHDMLVFRASTIADIAEQAAVIHTMDSLLYLSTLSEIELAEYLEELERGAKKKNRGKEGITDFIEEALPTETAAVTKSGDWYFYNPNLRSMGYDQFLAVWGDRMLEDNWRRLNKEADLNLEMIAGEGEPDPELEEVKATEKQAALSIPETEEEIAAVKRQLADAHYEYAQLYRNNLEINSGALKGFTVIAEEHLEFPLIDRVYYYLHLIHAEEGDLSAADSYRQLLLDSFPGSHFTYAIEYRQTEDTVDGQAQEESSPAEQLYASAYHHFEEGRYLDVIRGHGEASSSLKGNPLMPKFDFLEALSYGHLDSLELLREKLGLIIANYPNHEVEAKAREYLSIINRTAAEQGDADTVTVITETDTTAFLSVFSNEESNNLFGMIIVDGKDTDVRHSIQQIDRFNTDYFESRKLRVSNAYLDKDTPLVLIKRFREKTDASVYLGALEKSLPDLFEQEAAASLSLMIISQENFRILFTTKKLEEYRTFFERTFQ